MDEQGIAEMAVVTVDHPIAGRNPADTAKLVDGFFPDLLQAAIQWQPSK